MNYIILVLGVGYLVNMSVSLILIGLVKRKSLTKALLLMSIIPYITLVVVYYAFKQPTIKREKRNETRT